MRRTPASAISGVLLACHGLGPSAAAQESESTLDSPTGCLNNRDHPTFPDPLPSASLIDH